MPWLCASSVVAMTLCWIIVVAFLGLQFPVEGQGARAAQQQKQHWIGTWVAAPTARVDQPGGSRQP